MFADLIIFDLMSYSQKCIFHPPFHRDSMKFTDLLLTSTSKFLQQIARFQLSRGVTDGKSNTAADSPDKPNLGSLSHSQGPEEAPVVHRPGRGHLPEVG